jgi:small subunit ribosomal protein S7
MKESSKNEYINDDYQYIYSKLLNLLMYNGKKNIARKIIDKALDTALLKVNESSKKKILVKAILNAAPDIEIKSRRVGSSVYQVPIPLDSFRKLNFGIRFILEASRGRKEYKMIDKFSLEIIDAYNNKGLAIKKKDDLHKLGEANKSFSHFNW